MYLEVFLFVNLGMNLFILKTASLIARKDTPVKRLLGGAAAGTLLACIGFTWLQGTSLWWIVTGSAPLLMVLTTFFPLRGRELLFLCGTVFLTAFLLGGILEAVSGGQGGSGVVTLWWLAIACLVVVVLLWLLRPYLEEKGWQEKLQGKVEVKLGGMRRMVPAILDTGNRVKEPFGHKPVILVDYLELKEVVSEGLNLPLPVEKFDPVHILEAIVGHPGSERFYLIPFKNAGGQPEMLLGFRPDEVCVFSGNEGGEVGSKVALGLYQKPFGGAGEIKALMPPEVLQMVG